MAKRLSSAEMKQGKRYYNLFQAISSMALPLVNGAIITLYAIKVGASSTLIGLIASFNYLSYLAVPLGRALIPKLGASGVYGWGMLLRFVFILPILLIPLFIRYNLHLSVYALLTFSSIGFNFFRGMAMLGQNPVVDQICSSSKDRSRYLAITMIIIFLFTIIGNLFLALGLNIFNNSYLAYTLLIGIGCVLGGLSGYYLLQLPKTPPSKEKTSIIKTFRNAVIRYPFKRFIITYFGVSFVMALTRPFIVVYAKGPYMQSDSNAILYTTVAAMGSFMMGLFSRMIINLVGSKTLYVFFMSVASLSLIPAVASPQLSGSSLVLFLTLFHLISAFGMQGVESNSQTYFFTVVRQEEIVDLSTVYFLTYGLGGALGSTLGGALLDLFPRFLSKVASFQLFFALALVGYLVILFFLLTLKNTGKYSVRDGLGFILSIKDIKAINLANKLEETISATKQRELLHEIARTDSDAPIELLVESLSSPRLFVRREALFALENIPPTKDAKLVEALLSQLRSYPYTTAYMAARILGRNHIRKAIPTLRRTMNSPDYHLKAESILALGRLHDTDTIPKILQNITPEANPYVAIQAINALERLCSIEQATLLFKPFKWAVKSNSGIANEALLSAVTIIDLEEWFYPLYITFLQNKTEAYNGLTEIYVAAKKKKGSHPIIEELIKNPKSLVYYKQMKNFLENNKLLPFSSDKVQTSFAHAALNPVLFRYAKMRFFFISTALASHLHIAGKKS